jgi:hypothetical protein
MKLTLNNKKVYPHVMRRTFLAPRLLGGAWADFLLNGFIDGGPRYVESQVALTMDFASGHEHAPEVFPN